MKKIIGNRTGKKWEKKRKNEKTEYGAAYLHRSFLFNDTYLFKKILLAHLHYFFLFFPHFPLNYLNLNYKLYCEIFNKNVYLVI